MTTPTTKERFEETKTELLAQINSAITKLETRHSENPEDWNVVSDFDDLAKAVTDALKDNGY